MSLQQEIKIRPFSTMAIADLTGEYRDRDLAARVMPVSLNEKGNLLRRPDPVVQVQATKSGHHPPASATQG
jgi:hypothetical protein